MISGHDDRGNSVVGSILFTDLVGFTNYTATNGNEAAVDVLDVQAELIDKTAVAAGGRVVKELGDGVMIWFGDSDPGFCASVDLHRALAAARLERRLPLAVRMGLHHGEALERGNDVVGHSVNLAARIVALAGPGELLVSDDLLASAGDRPDGVRVEPVGPVPIRGVDDPVWLHRVALAD